MADNQGNSVNLIDFITTFNATQTIMVYTSCLLYQGDVAQWYFDSYNNCKVKRAVALLNRDGQPIVCVYI